jgi:hypothetical protein
MASTGRSLENAHTQRYAHRYAPTQHTFQRWTGCYVIYRCAFVFLPILQWSVLLKEKSFFGKFGSRRERKREREERERVKRTS